MFQHHHPAAVAVPVAVPVAEMWIVLYVHHPTRSHEKLSSYLIKVRHYNVHVLDISSK